MSTTLQRVRELQEQIRAQEELLKSLTQTPEFLAEQEFVKDIQDVLELHSRTLREAVLAIDPAMLGAAPKAEKKTYKPRTPKLAAPKAAPEKSHAEVMKLPDVTPAPPLSDASMMALKALESATNKHAPKGVTVTGEPRVRAPNTGKGTDPAKAAWNAKRSAANRLEKIRAGGWFEFTNPHTGEKAEGSKINTDTLRAWAAEYGKAVVEKWARQMTEEEARGAQA